MPASAAHILDFLGDRVLLCDGGMGMKSTVSPSIRTVTAGAHASPVDT